MQQRLILSLVTTDNGPQSLKPEPLWNQYLSIAMTGNFIPFVGFKPLIMVNPLKGNLPVNRLHWR